MTTPGGSGNWGPNQYGSGQYYDPITGQPSGHSPSGYSGYQQNSGSQYQGFGMFEHQQGRQDGPRPGPPPPKPPRKNRAALISTLAITAVGVVVITATLVIVGGDDTTNRATPVTTSRTTAPSSTTSTSSGSSSTESSSHDVPAAVPGWQGVAVPDPGIAYDIPPGWEPRIGRYSGFENKAGERVSMTNFSSYMRDFCSEADVSYRARVGMTATEKKDPVLAAEKAIRKWARLGWSLQDGTPPRIAMEPAKPVSVEGNSKGQPHLVSATITSAAPGPCGIRSVFISILALPSDTTAALLIGIADQGVPGAVSPATINRSLTSLRWLPE